MHKDVTETVVNGVHYYLEFSVLWICLHNPLSMTWRHIREAEIFFLWNFIHCLWTFTYHQHFLFSPFFSNIALRDQVLKNGWIYEHLCTNSNSTCEIWSFHNSVAEDSGLVQCYAVSDGKWLLMFQRTVVLHLQGQATRPKTHPKCWYPQWYYLVWQLH